MKTKILWSIVILFTLVSLSYVLYDISRLVDYKRGTKSNNLTTEIKLKICQRRAFVTKEGITISPAKKGYWVVGYPNQFLGEGGK